MKKFCTLMLLVFLLNNAHSAVEPNVVMIMAKSKPDKTAELKALWHRVAKNIDKPQRDIASPWGINP